MGTSASIPPLLIGLSLCGAIVFSDQDARAASATDPADLATMRALALELLRHQDYDRSIALYREIARQSPRDPESHYDLAAALSFVRRYEEAARPIGIAIRLAPEDLKAQEMAALIFLNLRWFEQAFQATLNAAKLGESTAMFSVVNMYEQGQGVEQDADEAVYWAVQAAERGHLGAMALMEEAYGSGRLGRTIDDEKARAWAKRLQEAKSSLE